MSETYRIDEARRRVYVTMGGKETTSSYMGFHRLAEISSSQIIEGRGVWRFIAPRRREHYAVARDELIDRGLIEDRA